MVCPLLDYVAYGLGRCRTLKALPRSKHSRVLWAYTSAFSLHSNDYCRAQNTTPGNICGIAQSAKWAYLDSTSQASSGRAFRRGLYRPISHSEQCHMHFLARYQFSTNLNQYNNRKKVFLDLYLNLQRFHG